MLDAINIKNKGQNIYPRLFCVVPYDKRGKRLLGYEAVYEVLESCHIYAASLFKSEPEVERVVVCVTTPPHITLERVHGTLR